MRDEYRDDAGPEGMQAQAAEGSPAERVQAVIADEAFHQNTDLNALVREIRLLVRSIGILVVIVGIAVIYMITRA